MRRAGSARPRNRGGGPAVAACGDAPAEAGEADAAPPAPEGTSTPPVVAGVESEYISGVGKLQDRLLILLDLDKLLSSEDLENLTQM